MRFHGMAGLSCFLKINSIYHYFPLIKSQYPYRIFICPAPYWQGICRAGWLNLSIVRNRERFPFPARPPACCSGCPHRAEVSLWLPLGLPAMGSPHRMPLAAFLLLLRSFGLPHMGQAGHGEDGCPAQLYQGETS